MADLALIGGTGVYDPALWSSPRTESVQTPYGAVEVEIGLFQGREIAFLARHGKGHSIPPHRINHRANIWALKALGVRRAVGTAAVGSLNPEMNPGDIVIVDQFLDFTKSHPTTFFDGDDRAVRDWVERGSTELDLTGRDVVGESEPGGNGDSAESLGSGGRERDGGVGKDSSGSDRKGAVAKDSSERDRKGGAVILGGVVHMDMTEPYCPELRAAAIAIGERIGVSLHRAGTYVCVEGPRYETAAEIKMYRILGADVVGMTNAPEAMLAREAGICYAALAAVTNLAAGISPTPLSHEEVSRVMESNTEKVRVVALESLLAVGAEPRCACGVR